MKLFFLLLLFATAGYAQENNGLLTIQDCYQLARQNYPLSKKRELIDLSNEYTVDNIAKGYFPQFSILGQATYQSAVTKLPISIPGTSISSLNKDQYKAYSEINQVLYDGGMIKQQQDLSTSQTKVMQQQLEVDLYAVKQKVNDLYFGVLLFEEQLRQNNLLKDDLNIGIKSIAAQLAAGTAYRSSVDLLKAEYLKADQQAISIRSYRKAYLEMLGLFIGRELNDNTKLSVPKALAETTDIHRPELALFEYRNTHLDLGKKTILAGNRPKLNLFVQSGIGNPALNFLKEGFEWYYIGGVRLNWSFSGLYTARKQNQLIDLNKQELEADKGAFLFQTQQLVKLQSAEIDKLQQYLATDDEIITLRSRVKKAALAQLENGVITPSDYLREVNEEHEAVQSKTVHQTELLLAQYRQILITGN
ncbi:outer membrane protein TolC [Pedobacter sp. UYP24]